MKKSRKKLGRKQYYISSEDSLIATKQNGVCLDIGKKLVSLNEKYVGKTQNGKLN